MRIEVLEILDVERREVRFRSELGEAWGVWQGDGLPGEGQFDVEVDIPEAVTTWLAVEEEIGMLKGGRYRRRVVTLCGTVKTVGEDFVTSVRVGRDIVLVEISKETVLPQPGTSIMFDTPEIQLYPYQL
ncbi:hypothetical protein ABZ915_05550 [Streptomyces sp. NPDC046915]|uniref:hypothetical protein n=1 Tax=Streptomyces sp. NPDC046915 TaxID=3155257 RepID=UPI0033BFD0D6